MSERDAVRAAVLDHVESWFDGDSARLEGVLHPSYTALEQLTAEDLIEATANGTGRGEDSADRRISIDISYLHGNQARAICLSHRYVEMLELVRTSEGWKILSGTWRSRASLGHPALVTAEEHSAVVGCKTDEPWAPPRRPAHSERRGRRRR
jgi:hypothetical protein